MNRTTCGNPVLVDPRRGSKELFDALARKIDCQMDDQLPAGDFVFEGYVPNGRGLIGIERKRISDLLDCICTGRFAGLQLIEMTQLFQWNYLVIEGLWRANKDTGFLETWKGNNRGWEMARVGSRAFKYADFDHHVTTLTNMTDCKVFRTTGIDETVAMVVSKYTWHNDKQWHQHTSHLAIHQAPKPGDRVAFRKPPLRRVVACDLPRIGWDRSIAVADKFPTTEVMINATVKQWMEIDGIGEGIARQVYDKIRSE